MNQTQSHSSVSFFEMPLPIRVNGSGGESEIVRLEVTDNGQVFDTPINFDITSIEIDPEVQLISKNNNAVLGVDDLTLHNEITIYPNPVKSILTINNNSPAHLKRITFYDVLGKIVLQKENPQSKVSIDDLNIGLFLLKIDTDKGAVHKTILKK